MDVRGVLIVILETGYTPTGRDSVTPRTPVNNVPARMEMCSVSELPAGINVTILPTRLIVVLCVMTVSTRDRLSEMAPPSCLLSTHVVDVHVRLVMLCVMLLSALSLSVTTQ